MPLRPQDELRVVLVLPWPSLVAVPGLVSLLARLRRGPLVLRPRLARRLPVHRELRLAPVHVVAPHPRRERVHLPVRRLVAGLVGPGARGLRHVQLAVGLVLLIQPVPVRRVHVQPPPGVQGHRGLVVVPVVQRRVGLLLVRVRVSPVAVVAGVPFPARRREQRSAVAPGAAEGAGEPRQRRQGPRRVPTRRAGGAGPSPTLGPRTRESHSRRKGSGVRRPRRPVCRLATRRDAPRSSPRRPTRGSARARSTRVRGGCRRRAGPGRDEARARERARVRQGPAKGEVIDLMGRGNRVLGMGQATRYRRGICRNQCPDS